MREPLAVNYQLLQPFQRNILTSTIHDLNRQLLQQIYSYITLNNLNKRLERPIPSFLPRPFPIAAASSRRLLIYHKLQGVILEKRCQNGSHLHLRELPSNASCVDPARTANTLVCCFSRF